MTYIRGISTLIVFVAMSLCGLTRPVTAADAVPDNNIAAQIQAIQQASDPSAAVGAFANGLAIDKTNVKLYEAYVDRMVVFGLPGLALHQAQVVTTLDPAYGVGWGVIAYSESRQGNMDGALSAIVPAVQNASNDKFVQASAGELLAWYDKNNPSVAQGLKDSLAAIKTRLASQTTYAQAYKEAKDAYEKQATAPSEPTTNPGDQQAAAPPDQPYAQAPQPQDQSGPVTYENNYYYDNGYDNGYGYANGYAYYGGGYGPGWSWWSPVWWPGPSFLSFGHHHGFFDRDDFHHGDWDRGGFFRGNNAFRNNVAANRSVNSTLVSRQNGSVVTHGPTVRSGFAVADPPSSLTAAARTGRFASQGTMTPGVTTGTRGVTAGTRGVTAGTGRTFGMTGSASPNATATPRGSNVVTPLASVTTSNGRTITRTFTPGATGANRTVISGSGRTVSTPSAARSFVTTPGRSTMAPATGARSIRSTGTAGIRSSGSSFRSSGGSFRSSGGGGGSFRGGGGGHGGGGHR